MLSSWDESNISHEPWLASGSGNYADESSGDEGRWRPRYFASQISHEGSKLMVRACSVIWEAQCKLKHRALCSKRKEKSTVKGTKKKKLSSVVSLLT